MQPGSSTGRWTGIRSKRRKHRTSRRQNPALNRDRGIKHSASWLRLAAYLGLVVNHYMCFQLLDCFGPEGDSSSAVETLSCIILQRDGSYKGTELVELGVLLVPHYSNQFFFLIFCLVYHSCCNLPTLSTCRIAEIAPILATPSQCCANSLLTNPKVEWGPMSLVVHLSPLTNMRSKYPPFCHSSRCFTYPWPGQHRHQVLAVKSRSLCVCHFV